MRSTTPSRSSAAPLSRCRTITGAIGRRQSPWASWPSWTAQGSDATMTLSRAEIARRLAEADYIADDELVTAVELMQMLGRALLLEGEAGVGKTAVAQALARVHGT